MKLAKLNIKDLEAYYNMTEKILEMLGNQIRISHNSNGFNNTTMAATKEEQKYKEIFAKKTILIEEITKRLMDIEK